MSMTLLRLRINQLEIMVAAANTRVSQALQPRFADLTR
jgi:hypothetical protein